MRFLKSDIVLSFTGIEVHGWGPIHVRHGLPMGSVEVVSISVILTISMACLNTPVVLELSQTSVSAKRRPGERKKARKLMPFAKLRLTRGRGNVLPCRFWPEELGLLPQHYDLSRRRLGACFPRPGTSTANCRRLAAFDNSFKIGRGDLPGCAGPVVAEVKM